MMKRKLYTCKNCGEIASYNERFDSFFCKDCNVWLESQCDDEHCSYCAHRPLTPDATRRDVRHPATVAAKALVVSVMGALTVLVASVVLYTTIAILH